MAKDKCAAKVGRPYHMRECGEPVEYAEAGSIIFGTTVATYTGWYHIDAGHTHHAVSARWTV